MKKTIGFLVIGLFFFSIPSVFGVPPQSINPHNQIKYSPLADGEAIAGASASQELTNKTMSGGSNSFSDLPLNALAAGSPASIIVHDGTGVPSATDTLPVGVHVDAQSVDSGVLDAARIPASIARVDDVTASLSAHAGLASGVHGLPSLDANKALKPVRINATADGYESYEPTSGATFKRAEITLAVATSTITFTTYVDGSTPVSMGNFEKCVLLVNGLGGRYVDFLKTSSNVAEYQYGPLGTGTSIILLQTD